MKDNLHVDTVGIQGSSSEITTLGGRIYDDYQDFKQIVDDLNSSWVGQGHDSTMHYVNDISSRADKNFESIKNLSGFLDGVVVPGFNETENNNRTLAELYK